MRLIKKLKDIKFNEISFFISRNVTILKAFNGPWHKDTKTYLILFFVCGSFEGKS
jgi:hypothetical protein